MRMKQAKKAYLPSDLPKTRYAAFFDRLKMDPWRFLGLGGILLAFALPMLITGALRDLALFQNASESAPEAVFSISFYGALIRIPGLMFFSLGLMGALRILRQECWDEPLFFGSDFFLGIKNGWSNALLHSFVLGALLFLAMLGRISGVYSSWVVGIFLGLIMFLIFPASFHSLFLSEIYALPLFRNFRAGYTVSFHSYWKTLLISLFLLLPLVFLWIPSLLGRYLALALSLLLYYPLALLASCLAAFSIYDPLINVKDYPELVRKGLYQGEDENS